MLIKPNVRVEKYVDQSRILQEADVFVTHHGINSTHESVYHGAPMISYPFFADQPALAGKCQQLGFAVPLTDSPRGRVSTEHVNAAITLFQRNRESLSEKVFMAREWEREVIAGRDDVLQQIMALI
jgi:UDP:flavonoid glycosyltransferase YjiC (YdhE family)